MNKILRYTIMVVMCLSLFSNFWLLISLGYNDIDWQYAYEQNDIEWCENTNDWIDHSNDLVIELQYYDSVYYEINITENVDCWNYDADQKGDEQ